MPVCSTAEGEPASLPELPSLALAVRTQAHVAANDPVLCCLRAQPVRRAPAHGARPRFLAGRALLAAASTAFAALSALRCLLLCGSLTRMRLFDAFRVLR